MKLQIVTVLEYSPLCLPDWLGAGQSYLALGGAELVV